jgi:hypothetical protein
MTSCLAAQNTNDYKYIIAPVDTCAAWELNVMEINDRYYFFSNLFETLLPGYCGYGDLIPIVAKMMPVVTVYDKDLNRIEQRELTIEGMDFSKAKFFYSENYFYSLGYTLEMNTFFFIKYNEDFSLVQPPIFYVLDDTLDYEIAGTLLTQKGEFIALFNRWDDSSAWLLHIDNKGELLQEMFFYYPDLEGIPGVMVETDSNYIMNCGLSYYQCIFNKDSLNKYESVLKTGAWIGLPEISAIAVGNQLIRSYYSSIPRTNVCKKDETITDYDRAIIFFNEDNSTVKNRLTFGNLCKDDRDMHAGLGCNTMDYINPDSIYYAYTTFSGSDHYDGSTVSIANFSWDGKLNFNYTLDMPSDSLPFKLTAGCKALSDGGVLIYGTACKYWITTLSNQRGFLVYYHPAKDVNIKEHASNTERKIFPNPARSQFTITNTEHADIRLYNIVGQEVFSTYSKEENTVINIDFLPQGLYVLKVVKEGNSSVHKVVVKD